MVAIKQENEVSGWYLGGVTLNEANDIVEDYRKSFCEDDYYKTLVAWRDRIANGGKEIGLHSPKNKNNDRVIAEDVSMGGLMREVREEEMDDLEKWLVSDEARIAMELDEKEETLEHPDVGMSTQEDYECGFTKDGRRIISVCETSGLLIPYKYVDDEEDEV